MRPADGRCDRIDYRAIPKYHKYHEHGVLPVARGADKPWGSRSTNPIRLSRGGGLPSSALAASERLQ